MAGNADAATLVMLQDAAEHQTSAQAYQTSLQVAVALLLQAPHLPLTLLLLLPLPPQHTAAAASAAMTRALLALTTAAAAAAWQDSQQGSASEG
jgi:hypothetical protein